MKQRGWLLAAASGLGLLATAWWLPARPANAHNMSPRAGTTQHVGGVVVTVDYARPAVRGRVIWGELVPYGQVWKTGADRMTTITFSKPVKIAGKTLDAGSYGVLSIPGESGWIVVLTTRTDLHRPADYTTAADALRFELRPEAAEHQERLEFRFENLEMSSADLVLHWERVKLRIPLAE
jgi:hypothetical protein